MHPSSTSHHRLHADIRRLLSTLLQRDVSDPRLADISITRIDPVSGGHTLVVWVHGFHTEDKADCIRRLNRLVPHFMHALRHALPRRRLPDITFHWDRAVDEGGRVLDILQQLGSGHA